MAGDGKGQGQSLDLVWGAKNIGAEIGKTEKAAFHLLERGLIPARKVGRQWVSDRASLKRRLTGDGEAA
jgi:hypothetical protein